jgi:hypothetical protein
MMPREEINGRIALLLDRVERLLSFMEKAPCADHAETLALHEQRLKAQEEVVAATGNRF